MVSKTADEVPRERRAPDGLSERAQEVFAALCRLEQDDATEVVRQWVILNAWEERLRMQAALQRPADGSIPDEDAWREWYGDLGPVERELELLAREIPPREARATWSRQKRQRAAVKWNTRWDALQVKRRAALGIDEREWNAAADEQRDRLLEAAYDAFYEARWRAQREGRKLTFERLDRFYSGSLHIPEVDRVADAITAIVRARHHVALAALPASLESRIAAFADDLAQVRRRARERWPKKWELPRLGKVIDVLLDDAANPKPFRRGSGRKDRVPPGLTKRRITRSGNEVKVKPWRQIAKALGSKNEGVRIQSAFMELALDALELIERSRT